MESLSDPIKYFLVNWKPEPYFVTESKIMTAVDLALIATLSTSPAELKSRLLEIHSADPMDPINYKIGILIGYIDSPPPLPKPSKDLPIFLTQTILKNFFNNWEDEYIIKNERGHLAIQTESKTVPIFPILLHLVGFHDETIIGQDEIDTLIRELNQLKSSLKSDDPSQARISRILLEIQALSADSTSSESVTPEDSNPSTPPSSSPGTL